MLNILSVLLQNRLFRSATSVSFIIHCLSSFFYKLQPVLLCSKVISQNLYSATLSPHNFSRHLFFNWILAFLIRVMYLNRIDHLCISSLTVWIVTIVFLYRPLVQSSLNLQTRKDRIMLEHRWLHPLLK